MYASEDYLYAGLILGPGCEDHASIPSEMLEKLAILGPKKTSQKAWPDRARHYPGVFRILQLFQDSGQEDPLESSDVDDINNIWALDGGEAEEMQDTRGQLGLDTEDQDKEEEPLLGPQADVEDLRSLTQISECRKHVGRLLWMMTVPRKT